MNVRWLMVIAIGICGLPLPRAAAQATTRAIVPFQGSIVVKPGQPPLDADPYPIRFRIYPTAAAGEVKHSEVQNRPIRNGVFAADLGGGGTALDPNLPFFNSDLWLELAVDTNRNTTFETGEIMAPRIHIGSSFSSLYSVNATTANSANSALAAATLTLPATLRDGSNNAVSELNTDGSFVGRKDLGHSTAPRRGGTYRDNACIAWGSISSDGAILSGFGIKTASYDSDDRKYTIELFNDVNLRNNNEELSIVVTSLDFDQRPELAIYELIDETSFAVTIFGFDVATVTNGALNVPRVQSGFSVQVFGRPN